MILIVIGFGIWLICDAYKDYAEIQRNLGYIEGLIQHAEQVVFDGVTAAVEAIDKIVSGEMAGDTE